MESLEGRITAVAWQFVVGDWYLCCGGTVVVGGGGVARFCLLSDQIRKWPRGVQVHKHAEKMAMYKKIVHVLQDNVYIVHTSSRAQNIQSATLSVPPSELRPLRTPVFLPLFGSIEETH
jgi:hypothetical protein